MSFLSTAWSASLGFLETWKTYIVATLFAGALAFIGFYGYKAGSLVTQTRWDREKVASLEDRMELSRKISALQGEALNVAAAQAVKDAAAQAAAAAERERLELNGRAIFSRIDRLTRDLKASPQYAACVLDPQTLKELNGSLGVAK